ncbi:MFS transporter [Bradyrhizobium mercantei]|uniref:MFS transporter n=1 Tax=Bradyrhizobium mercantei TaxID=1904807 RepID=UPI000975E559|nr:MFS transporter [Bradyrhizobium mercantei]
MRVHAELVANNQNGYVGTRTAAWAVFALTFLLMLFDFIDRQVIVSMLPIIKAEWKLSDTQLGGLISIVAFTVGVLSIPVAIVADRWSRVKCVFVMAAIWSLATIACGYATSYLQLLSLRGLVGAGEAGYNAVGSAILAARFPARMRALVLASFTAAATVGVVTGVVLGGIIAKNYGWQLAFGIVGIPGLILAFLYLFVEDYETVKITDGRASNRPSLLGMAQLLLQTPSAMIIYIASGLQLFVVSTMFSWLASFFNRSYGLSVDKAGIRAAMLLLAGCIGTILWGYLADYFGRTGARNKIWVMAASAFSSALVLPLAFGVFSPGPIQVAMITLGCILMTGTIGPVGAVAVDVVHPGVRATALAVGVLVQNLLGQAAGPFFTGFLSDRYGLSFTLSVVPLAGVLAAVAFLFTLRRYDRDLTMRTHSPATGTHVGVIRPN